MEIDIPRHPSELKSKLEVDESQTRSQDAFVTVDLVSWARDFWPKDQVNDAQSIHHLSKTMTWFRARFKGSASHVGGKEPKLRLCGRKPRGTVE